MSSFPPTVRPHKEPSRAGRLRAQLEEGFAALIFGGDLEQEFRVHAQPLMLRLARLSVIAAGLLIGGFVLLDTYWMGQQYPLRAHHTLLYFCAPISIFAGLISFIPRFSKRPDVINAIMVWVQVVGWLSIYPILIKTPDRPPFAFEALLAFAGFTYALSGLFFWQAMASGVTMCCGFLIEMYLHPLSTPALLYCTFYVVAVNVAGVTSSYIKERALRTSYLNGELVQELAERDALTGIYNRRAFAERLETLVKQARRDEKPLAVVIVDADHFKTINDTAGHAFGDSVLCTIANALVEVSRRPLDFCARQGGDEFVAVWYGLDRAALARSCQALHHCFADQVAPLQARVEAPLSLSIGVSHGVPALWMTGPDLLKRADRALYRTKHNGRAGTHVVGDDDPDSGAPAALRIRAIPS